MKGKKPMRNRNGRDFLSTAEYREHLELYGDKLSSIFAGISPGYKARSSRRSSNLNHSSLRDGVAKDIDMGFSNNGLR